MKEILMTKEELDYYSNPEPINVVREDAVPYKPQKTFAEESKDCITLEEFSRMWDELIDNDPRLI